MSGSSVRSRMVLGLLASVAVAACGDDGPPAWQGPGSTGATDTDDPSGPADGSTVADSTTGSDSSEASTDDPGDGSSTGDVPMDDPGDPFAEVPPFEPLDDGAVAALGQTLDGILDGGALGGAAQGVLVVDLETDQVLYAREADTVRVPASNTKMFTTAATMDILDPDTRVETEIWAAASPDASGVVAGDLELVGHHDFTWSTDFYASARAPLDRIAQELFDLGVRRISGDVIARGEFCYEGQSLGTYNAPAHRGTASVRFRDALSAVGIVVDGAASSSSDFDPPAGSVELMRWQSPPFTSMAVPVNVRSHNEDADIMLRHLGFRTDGVSTYEAGGQQIVDWMGSLPTDNSEAVWNDGSGLDHGNRTSPRNIVDLLRFMQQGAAADRWTRSMAIAGVRGTLAGRMTGADTLGRFWGKTGTLPSIGVVSLSGILFHRYDGRRYAISILFNGVPNVTSARTVQNQVVEAVAVDLHGVGGRPAAPELTLATGAASDVVELEWSEVSGADGYALWVSADGESWPIEDARRIDGTSHRAGELAGGGDVFFRVTAFTETAGAVHSVASNVFAATADVGPASVLLVDGNERWRSQPVVENPRGVGHGFVARYVDAMPDVRIDTASHDAVADEAVDLLDYDAVVWMLGEESSADLTFDELEQSVVTSYLDDGGALFVSGAELAYDLAAVGTPEDTAFLEDVLHTGYAGDDADTWWMGAGQGAFDGAPPIGFNTRDGIVADFPDQLDALGGAEALLAYRGGLGGAAVVGYDGSGATPGRTVVMGVPFESLEGVDDRVWLMERVLTFLQAR